MRFVLYPEEGAWVIMCLEKYIGAQANSPPEAVQALKCVYAAELDFGRMNDIACSPARFWNMFDELNSVIKGTIKQEEPHDYDRAGTRSILEQAQRRPNGASEHPRHHGPDAPVP